MCAQKFFDVYMCTLCTWILHTAQKGWGNTPQYLIPNNYIVETEVAKWNVRCETKYISNLKVCYTISWKEGNRD